MTIDRAEGLPDAGARFVERLLRALIEGRRPRHGLTDDATGRLGGVSPTACPKPLFDPDSVQFVEFIQTPKAIAESASHNPNRFP